MGDSVVSRKVGGGNKAENAGQAENLLCYRVQSEGFRGILWVIRVCTNRHESKVC